MLEEDLLDPYKESGNDTHHMITATVIHQFEISVLIPDSARLMYCRIGYHHRKFHHLVRQWYVKTYPSGQTLSYARYISSACRAVLFPVFIPYLTSVYIIQPLPSHYHWMNHEHKDLYNVHLKISLRIIIGFSTTMKQTRKNYTGKFKLSGWQYNHGHPCNPLEK